MKIAKLSNKTTQVNFYNFFSLNCFCVYENTYLCNLVLFLKKDY